MLYPSNKLLCFLALLPSSALADKKNTVTKTFKFKEDFFLKFHPLPTAIGPDASVDVLMPALDGFAERFKEVWVDKIESDLQGGDCTVDKMRLPEFSMCDWKYPDRYDVDELPTPGQCYDYEYGFVSSMFFKVILISLQSIFASFLKQFRLQHIDI